MFRSLKVRNKHQAVKNKLYVNDICLEILKTEG